MVTIRYVLPEGQEKTLEVEAGTSVMTAAVMNDIDGIVAECGGSRMCATCHVYVDEAFLDRLPEMTADEDEMLNAAASERKPNSRLSCQIVLSAEIDGLVVRIPDRQY